MKTIGRLTDSISSYTYLGNVSAFEMKQKVTKISSARGTDNIRSACLVPHGINFPSARGGMDTQDIILMLDISVDPEQLHNRLRNTDNNRMRTALSLTSSNLVD